MAYQYRRPYYPRVYNNRYQQNPNAGVSGALEIGSKFGEQVAKIIAQRKQDQIANQLAAQYGLYAPRAQWVGGTPPAAGVNTQGTTLADQGGVEGLKLRMAMQQRQQQQQAAQTKAAYQTALAQQQLGKGNSVWTGRGGGTSSNAAQPAKTGKYQANDYNFENGTLNGQKTSDSMAMLQTDINGQSGYKNMAASLLAAIPSMQIGKDGKLTIPKTKVLGTNNQEVDVSKYRINSDGSFSVLDANGNAVGTLGQDDLKAALNRYNAMQIRDNKTPIPNPYLQGSVPNTTLAPGSKENPYALDPNKPNTTFRALPPGSYFVDPKGNTQYKVKPGETAPPQTTAQTPNVPANQFSTPSEGGTSTDVTADSTVPPLIRRPTADDIGRTPATPPPKDDIGRTPATPPPKDDIGRSAFSDQSTGDNSAIAQIDPNTFAPPSQQDRNQVADVTLPNRDVVPVVTDEDRDLLNRMIAGQNLVDQYAQT